MDSVVNSQLAAFLADLRFVACLCAVGLYGLWVALFRPGLLGLARLSLVVAFGATVVAYGVSQVPLQAMPYTDFFLFMLLAVFLLLEFLFQMSVLGLLVSGVGTLVASLHYMRLIQPPRQPPGEVVAYWWILRDLAVTSGLAALVLGLGTALLLYYMQDRRTGKFVHPNDLKDVAALLARGAVPCFLFGLFAAIVGITRHPAPVAADWWSLVWLIVLFVLSIAWLLQAEQRRFSGRWVLTLIAANGLAVAAYSAERLIFTNLTSTPLIN